MHYLRCTCEIDVKANTEGYCTPFFLDCGLSMDTHGTNNSITSSVLSVLPTYLKLKLAH